MKLRRLAPLGCSLLLGLVVTACQAKSAAPPTQDAKAVASAKSPADAKTPGEAKAPAPSGLDGAGISGQPSEPAPPAAPSTADSPQPPTAAVDKSRGQHLVDPKWFRKAIFGDNGKVMDMKRSEADDQGLFSSLIRFELSDMNVDACAKHLEDKVKADVTNVQRKTMPDGRIQLDGNTDTYKITFVCGEAKGKTIAYVSYAWT